MRTGEALLDVFFLTTFIKRAALEPIIKLSGDLMAAHIGLVMGCVWWTSALVFTVNTIQVSAVGTLTAVSKFDSIQRLFGKFLCMWVITHVCLWMWWTMWINMKAVQRKRVDNSWENDYVNVVGISCNKRQSKYRWTVWLHVVYGYWRKWHEDVSHITASFGAKITLIKKQNIFCPSKCHLKVQ